MTNTLKFFHFSTLRNSLQNQTPTEDFGGPRLLGTKEFKIRVRPKLIYIVQINYYSNIALLKFHPKLFEDHPDKYKRVDVGLTHSEKRGLLNTCCKIVYHELEKNNNFHYGFFGQCYEKDDLKNREVTRRFDWYTKQVTTFFSDENYNHQKISIINFYCISKKKNSKFKANNFLLFLEQENLIIEFMTAKIRREFWKLSGFSDLEIEQKNIEFESRQLTNQRVNSI
jgi:hypothetical protein